MIFLESWTRWPTWTTLMRTTRSAPSKTSSTSSARSWATKSMATVKFMTPKRTNGSWLLICACPELAPHFASLRTITSSPLEVESIKSASLIPSSAMTSAETSGKRLLLLKSTNRSGCPPIWAWPIRSPITRSYSSVAKVLWLSTFSTAASYSMLRRWRFVSEAAWWILVLLWTRPWSSITVSMPTAMTFTFTSTTSQSRVGLSFPSLAQSSLRPDHELFYVIETNFWVDCQSQLDELEVKLVSRKEDDIVLQRVTHWVSMVATPRSKMRFSVERDMSHAILRPSSSISASASGSHRMKGNVQFYFFRSKLIKVLIFFTFAS